MKNLYASICASAQIQDELTMNKHFFRYFKFFLATVFFTSILSACTWVKPAEEAANVTIVEDRHITQCERLGSTSASVRDRVGFIDRSESKVAEELATLAKNSAVAMGGDTLVAVTEILDGHQEFIVYRCN
tara:strand:- start:343 stop:735 length:393 start_codon:yes stop_codon:yes gene_type:complete